MPRARKTQPVQAAAGQAYGERQAQEQAQEAMPLPAGPPTAAPAVAPGTGVAGAQDAALAMPPPDAPPWAGGPVDEPITHGLPSGPGPGPEALHLSRPRRAPVADMLLQMARATGDPRYAEMAQQAQYQG